MRKLVMVLVVSAVLLGVAGTALAENGSIWPWGSTKASAFKVRPMENSSIWPF